MSIQYAQVVVHVPLVSAPQLDSAEQGVPVPAPFAWVERSFTYDIPEALRSAIRVGQLVWVPFGARRLEGIVVGLAETTELSETSSIEAIVYPEPLLTVQQIELAQWMARRYLAPFADCIWLFLPPGIEDKVETLIELAPEAVTENNFTDKQRALIERVREAGSIKSTQVAVSQRAALNTLLARGILVKRTHVRPGRAKPRRIDTIRLATSPKTARAIIAGLDRRTAALRALASSPEPLTEEELISRTRVSDATLAKLEAEGVIERTPRTIRYQLRSEYLDALPALPEAQARVCVYLREHGNTATREELESALGAEAQTLTLLREKGWIEKKDESPRVRLLDRKYIPQLTASRARLERVIEFLAREKNPVWVSALYAATDSKRTDLQKLEQLGLVTLESAEIIRDPLAGRTFTPVAPPTLTNEQQAVWKKIQAALDAFAQGRADLSNAFLLHGVTGSGKTEIYLDAIERVLAHGGQAIALVPEISLTPQTIRRFGARFGERIGMIHSRLSDGERYDTWRRIREGKIDIVIGARSALFAPLPRLALIVIDEEHDPSYKNDVEFLNQPAYHAREVALELARTHGVMVILGSATPDVETYAQTTRGAITLLELPQRVIAHESNAGPIRYQELPPVEIVDLRAELVAGNRSVFSRALKQALNETLARGEQAILFLNRRGSATAVVCRDCGHALKCPRCNTPYTLHQFGNETPQELVCHHCGKRGAFPRKCPNCGSTRIRGLGLGTEKLEQAVRDEFPQARPLRWDFDVTQGKDAHEMLWDAFQRGDANVLIGTQMIAKGLDLPRVTLVGVVNADTGLYLPDFRASERTFQLLTQVAGRAGRGARRGKAILQTFNPTHYAIQAAARHNYGEFFGHELAFRQQTGYPPFRPLIRLLYSGDSANAARLASEQYSAALHDRIRREGFLDVQVIGPAPAFFGKLRGKYRYHILLRGRGAHSVLAAYAPPPAWRIDVDPLEML